MSDDEGRERAGEGGKEGEREGGREGETMEGDSWGWCGGGDCAGLRQELEGGGAAGSVLGEGEGLDRALPKTRIKSGSRAARGRVRGADQRAGEEKLHLRRSRAILRAVRGPAHRVQLLVGWASLAPYHAQVRGHPGPCTWCFTARGRRAGQ